MKTWKTIAQAYYMAIKNGADTKTVAKNTAQLLKKKNLLNSESKILNEVTRIWNIENNIISAQILSRYELSSSQKNQIEKDLKEKYKAREVLMEEKIDESLLGGIKITVEDEVMDGTLLKNLNQLQVALKL